MRRTQLIKPTTSYFKERDNESNYDYFGARYYDSRIGRWGQTEPLMEKYFSFSSYIYAGNNSINLYDLNGLDWIFYEQGAGYNKGWRVTMDGPDQYYIAHPSGKTYQFYWTDSKGKQHIIYEANYIKVHSKTTLDRYFQSEVDKKYTYEDVENLETDKNNKAIDERVAYFSFFKDYPIPGVETGAAGLLSKDKGYFDFKYQLAFNQGSLFYFMGQVFNDQEAGNILWGSLMRRIGFSEDFSMRGANIYSMLRWQRKDEENEQSSIWIGYNYY